MTIEMLSIHLWVGSRRRSTCLIQISIIMKKLYNLALIALFTLSISIVSAQSNRMAFVEEATQASCPPCATANPGIQTLMNANSETTIFMAYQVWWPGFDQMYLDNSAEVDVRVGDYYGYQFAPQVVIQGAFAGADGSTDNLTQQALDEYTAQPSEFDLDISAEIVNGQLNVTGNIEATMAASGDLKLRLMLVEEVIYATDAPGGTNGETEYHHVFKGFVGGTDGIDLEDAWNVGDTYAINETFNTPALTIYHWDGLEVIAIIQNDEDKFIHQAAKDSDIPITSEYENSASGGGIEGLPSAVCIGDATLSPTFKLTNNGNAELTSAVITYSINGEADQVYNWTGSLSTLTSEDVVLDPYAFTAGETNIVTATVSMPNGVMDEDAIDNDTSEAAFAAAPDAGTAVTVIIQADQYGDEIYWEIRNSGDDVIITGGNPNVGTENVATGTFPPPFSEESYANNSSNEIPFTLPADDCYTFHITDYFGDGILAPGYYEVLAEDGNVLIAEGDFSGEEINDFSGLEGVVGIEELNFSDFSIYPNPTNDLTNIAFEVISSEDFVLEVLDISGRVVYKEALGTLSAGNQLIQVDAKQFETGIYLFNMYSGAGVATERVTVVK